MSLFLCAHAGEADWQMALGACWAQIRHQLTPAFRPTLGWCYLTDHHTAGAGGILAALKARMPEVHWVGTVGLGVAAEATEYFGVPGMVLMLADLPEGSYRLFSSASPPDAGGFEAFTALVHADGTSPDLSDQLKALSEKTATGYLFGGLSSARNQPLVFADEVMMGGVCGVAFGADVPILSRVTQGCQPIGPKRTITRAEDNYLVTLDHARALDCALQDLGLDGEISDEELREALGRTLAGLSIPGEDVSDKPGQFGANTEVRHLVGVGRKAGVLVVADQLSDGMQLAFCTRNAEAAKADLARIVSQVRTQGEAAGGIRGALYISCCGRGGPHFGKANAEFEMVRQGLGPVPLVGFFAGGEIARHHLYGYTGVLTVFTEAA